ADALDTTFWEPTRELDDVGLPRSWIDQNLSWMKGRAGGKMPRSASATLSAFPQPRYRNDSGSLPGPAPLNTREARAWIASVACASPPGATSSTSPVPWKVHVPMFHGHASSMSSRATLPSPAPMPVRPSMETIRPIGAAQDASSRDVVGASTSWSHNSGQDPGNTWIWASVVWSACRAIHSSSVYRAFTVRG